MNILKEKVKEPESAKGVILDGVPRTLHQLDLYDKILPTHVVVNVTLRNDILLEKLSAYNIIIKFLIVEEHVLDVEIHTTYVISIEMDMLWSH